MSPATTVLHFLIDTTRAAMRGSRAYYAWLAFLTVFVLAGVLAYAHQIDQGLAVTGMNDQVSWGLYISNFTFLVGVAAAAVMVVLPVYVMHDADLRNAVLIGEGIAVGALVMCLCFVTVDIAGPARLWHLAPIIGRLNFPQSLLSWDIIVLNGYLALNALIPFYLLFCRYMGREPNPVYKGFAVLSIFWAVSIHLVTAFLYASQPARPFWHNGLLGPRFLASAFCGGTSLIMLVLWVIKSRTAYPVKDETFRKLALVVTVAAQINLIMLASEIFTEFYNPTAHTANARYLFLGLRGHAALVPWIWPALGANVVSTLLLTVNAYRKNMRQVLPLCALLFMAIWVDKGMGLIVPGFTPSPLGEIHEYEPSWVEIVVTLGIWALGLGVITVLVRVSILVELGQLVHRGRAAFVPQPDFEPRPDSRSKPRYHEPHPQETPKVREPRPVVALEQRVYEPRSVPFEPRNK